MSDEAFAVFKADLLGEQIVKPSCFTRTDDMSAAIFRILKPEFDDRLELNEKARNPEGADHAGELAR